MKKTELILKTCLVIVLVLAQAEAKATDRYTSFTHGPYRPTRAQKALKKGISSYWDSSRDTKSWVTIEFVMADDGKLYEPRISHYSGDDQYDAECLEAICASLPLALEECESGSIMLKHFIENFGKESPLTKYMYTAAYNGHDIKRFLANNPQPTDPQERFVVTHKIPLSVLDRYPGLFSREELFSAENLMKMSVGNPDPPDENGHRGSTMYMSRIPVYYSFFEHLFKENKNVTRESLWQCANSAAHNVKP